MKIIKLLFDREHWVEIAAIVVVGLASLLFSLEIISIPILVAAILLGAYPIAKEALLDLFTKKKIGTELFITVAVAVALLGGEYLAGAVVLMIILIAEYIASVSGERARASIRDLIGTVPKTAIIKCGDKQLTVDLASIKIDDIVLVRAGDKIPVDGVVVAGNGFANQAPITGESLPQGKMVGSDVYAGTILESGALDIRVTKLTEDTVFSRIIALVEEAESREPLIQKFTDRVATWLIPIAFVFVAVVYYYTQDIKLIIALLIFTSPAELGLATPLVTISAVARAAREGILVKGGLYLEALARADTFVFDKTGTLTLGDLKVDKIRVFDRNFDEREVLSIAAAADSRSGHPLAKTIVEYAKEINVSHIAPTEFAVLDGRGVKATVGGKQVLVGNVTLMHENSVDLPSDVKITDDTTVYVAMEGKLVGAILISSIVRPGARAAIQSLKAGGVKKVMMLTGDNEEAAKKIASQLAIDEVRADLLPEDKIKIVDQLQSEGRLVAMVGDGVNDAPALAAASVGVAMGSVGTGSAMEAADIVLVNDDLEKLAHARAISSRAYKTIRENIFVGVGVVHVVGIILVLTHVIGPIQAAIIHLVPDTLVFLNSIKLLKVKIY
ncbi:MAG: cadmium-translocating P-type ATPase [Candidatus Nomurabacteria bacterium]|nr:MAG: cadmium-translocating P-type ATPase [Candidatus Nomurabacteria bacterium]